MDSSTSEQSSSDRSTSVECAQPSNMDIPDGIQASIEEAPPLLTETQVEALSTDGFHNTEQADMLDGTTLLSSALLTPEIIDSAQESPTAVDISIQSSTISDVPSHQTTTEISPSDGSTTVEVTFSSQITTPKIPYGRARIREIKKALAVKLKQLVQSEEKKPLKPIEDDFFIPEGTTDFRFEKHTISVDVKDLYGTPLLGSGAFGSVYYARLHGPVIVDVAVKRVLRSAKAEVKTLELVAKSDHPNIVAYYCTVGNPETDEMCMCMEYMNASLATFSTAIHQLNPVPYRQVDNLLPRILRDCAKGLFHLQIKGLAHRDIKPDNILLNRDGIVKLCDFGISISLAELQLDETPEKGTELYIPPKRARNIQDDMWSLGLCLLEIAEGKNPFKPDANGVACSKLGWQSYAPTVISPQMGACIAHLMRFDPKDRPESYAEILSWSCVRGVSEIPSMEEKDFVRYVIDKTHQLDVLTELR